jgi:hypothetical protein
LRVRRVIYLARPEKDKPAIKYKELPMADNKRMM